MTPKQRPSRDTAVMTAPRQQSNPPKSTYRPEALKACLDTLGTLIKRFGDPQQKPTIVVIGGLVPCLLFDEAALEQVMEPHPGTNDVDLCVQLDVPADDRLYKEIRQILEESGFTPGKRASGNDHVWRWERRVRDVLVAVEFLTQADDLDAAAVGRLNPNEAIRPGDDIGALRIRGAALANSDAVAREIEIDLLDDGGKSKVTVWVANILPFIALKSFAAKYREKDKDCFDIVWVLAAWDGGPVEAGRVARKSSVADHPDVTDAIAFLAETFASVDHEGCRRYARFQHGTGHTEQHAQSALYAEGATRQFLDGWNEELAR